MEGDSKSQRQPIRVLLAEDHHVVRQALHTHLDRQDGIVVVAEVADGSNLLESIEIHRPDVLLMDLTMPNHEPVAATKELHERYPRLKIIVLSAHKPGQQVVALFQVGVDGYVLKDDPADAPIKAIKQVMEGREWISPQAASVLAGRIRRDRVDERPDLTPRQRQVLALMARGYRNEQIADELVLSEHTIRNHVANIFQKLGVETRVEAVVYGLATRLINLESVKDEMDEEWSGV